MPAAPVTFEPERRRLTALAYRMLGSVADAEDIVQEAYLRWHAADRAAVAQPRAFLATMVTRLCLDRLKSAQARRESYVGAWLPEPWLVEAEESPEAALELAGDLSVALMLALERLSPLERAAFLLHDVFDLPFAEVAEALGRSEAACRQLAARARQQVRAARPRYAPSMAEGARLAQAFLAASRGGDLAALERLLREDVVLWSDGGGKRPAALNPIRGWRKVSRFYAGLARKHRTGPPRMVRLARINGLPGYVTVEPDGTLQTTALEIADDRIAAVYIVRNPDKLAHLTRAPGLLA